MKTCEHCSSCIQGIPFLEVLPIEQQEHLIKTAIHSAYPKGAALFEQDSPADSLWVIHGGRVKLSRLDMDGREQVIEILGEGETIWEDFFSEDQVYPCSAICLEEVHTCRIPGENLDYILSHPASTRQVIRLLSKKLNDANRRTLLLMQTNPKARLAGFLADRSAHTLDGSVSLRLDDIAGSIGVRPETVSRKLRELIREGVIEKHGQSTFRIINRERLLEIAER